MKKFPYAGKRMVRMLTLQVLYALDSQGDDSAGLMALLYQYPDVLGMHIEELDPEDLEGCEVLTPQDREDDQVAEAIALAEQLWNRRNEVDVLISDNLEGWRFERLEGVDRAILRLAVYEGFVAKTVPQSVAMNEAVEVAKGMSGAESARFINGVLSTVLKATGQ